MADRAFVINFSEIQPNSESNFTLLATTVLLRENGDPPYQVTTLVPFTFGDTPQVLRTKIEDAVRDIGTASGYDLSGQNKIILPDMQKA